MSSRNIISVVNRCNNFLLPGSSKSTCVPFLIEDKHVGIIRQDILTHFKKYPDVFDISATCMKLSDKLKTVKERTAKVEEVLLDLREQKVLATLKGWRNETFDVRTSSEAKALIQIERAGVCLFGAISYGVHINGYFYKDNQLMMWVGRRSPTKPTFPNKLDNMCAGGLASGLGVKNCAVKECEEEASISEELTGRLKQRGCISYVFEDHRGVFPECEYVFDLELPEDFVPVNADGEVGGFELMNVDKLLDAITSQDFKPNSALIVVDFLVRHGIINTENERNLAYIVEMMHVPIQSYFSGKSELLTKNNIK